MATIINNVEVILEPLKPMTSASTGGPPPLVHPELRPRDLDDLADRRLRREARLIAH